MIENIDNVDNRIDGKHKVDEPKILDKGFYEEQIQEITQERKEEKVEQKKEAERLFQQNFPDETSTINGNIESQPIKNESQ